MNPLGAPADEPFEKLLRDFQERVADFGPSSSSLVSCANSSTTTTASSSLFSGDLDRPHKWVRDPKQDPLGLYRQCEDCGMKQRYGRRFGTNSRPDFEYVVKGCPGKPREKIEPIHASEEHDWSPQNQTDHCGSFRLCQKCGLRQGYGRRYGSNAKAGYEPVASKCPAIPKQSEYEKHEDDVVQKAHMWPEVLTTDHSGSYRICGQCGIRQRYGKKFGSNKHPRFEPINEGCFVDNGKNAALKAAVEENSEDPVSAEGAPESPRTAPRNHNWGSWQMDHTGQYRICIECHIKQGYGKRFGSNRYPQEETVPPCMVSSSTAPSLSIATFASVDTCIVKVETFPRDEARKSTEGSIVTTGSTLKLLTLEQAKASPATEPDVPDTLESVSRAVPSRGINPSRPNGEDSQENRDVSYSPNELPHDWNMQDPSTQDAKGHYRFCKQCFVKQYYGKLYGSNTKPAFQSVGPCKAYPKNLIVEPVNLSQSSSPAELRSKTVYAHQWSNLHRDKRDKHTILRVCLMCFMIQKVGMVYGDGNKPGVEPVDERCFRAPIHTADDVTVAVDPDEELSPSLYGFDRDLIADDEDYKLYP